MKNCLLVLANNVEDIEALGTRDLLIRAGISVTTSSYSDTITITTSHKLVVQADILFKDINIDQYDFLVIPGGYWVKQNLESDLKLIKLINEFNNRGSGVYAICAAPQYLGKAGILKDKPYVSFPGCDQHLDETYKLPNNKCVVISNIITSKGAGTTFEFAYEIINKEENKAKAEEVLKNTQYY
jgi:4-methyl-5(b-hydroxyethyl)-thiazole monophosphate biosynthesis